MLKVRKSDVLFSFGRSLRTPIETPSFAPSVAWFGETRAREIGVDLTGKARTSSKELPALMCGDRNLSRRGVERVHFQLRLEPGFYRFDFGFLTLLRKRIVKGDNCKYPLPSRDWRGKMYPYDGRMKEANARRYFREHEGQLDSEHPEATLGFQEIDEMDHQPQYARIEVLLDRKLIGCFNLSSPIYVESKNNTFKPHVYGRTFAIDEPREYTLTLQAVNRLKWYHPAVQHESIITEDFCPTLFRLSRTETPSCFNSFRSALANASHVDLWSWEYCIAFLRPGWRQVDLEYLKNLAREAHVWGSNLFEVYWTIARRDSGPAHVIEWPEDDPLKGGELYHRAPDSKWNNDKCRALNRFCHDLGMAVDWYQHIPLVPWSKKPFRDCWSPPQWWKLNFIELICREFADVLKTGWRDALDSFEEESGGGSNSIHALLHTHVQWKYHPGMAQCETHSVPDHRHVKGLLPGAIHAPTNCHFVWDDYHRGAYPFEEDSSEFGKQHLFLQSNCRTNSYPSIEKRHGIPLGEPSVAGPDSILQEANDFFRPRLRGTGPMVRSGIWWLGDVVEVMPPENRDYVYGISNDPVRAAAAGELSSTGTGGTIDSITSFFPDGCHHRHEKPAGTRFITNNHIRLYHDRDRHGGELLCDIEGLADYTTLGPAISLVKDPFRTVLMEGPTEYKKKEDVEHSTIEPAGHVAVLEERIAQEYNFLGISIKETRRYEMVADSPYVTLAIDRAVEKSNKKTGFAQGALDVCMTLELSGYDIIEGSLKARRSFAQGSFARPLIILRDSRAVRPALFVLLVKHSAEQVTLRFSPRRGLQISSPRRAREKFLIRFGALTGWLTKKHLPELAKPEGFASRLASSGGEIRNSTPLPVIRKVCIKRKSPTPWFVKERGWWIWQGTKPSREKSGTETMRVYIDGNKKAEIRPEGFLGNIVKPGWGSQYQLAIGQSIRCTKETARVDCWVRSVTALLFAPRLEFKKRIAAVQLDGRPWYYFDDNLLFLPNREGKYRVAVTFGKPVTPRLLSTMGVPSEFKHDRGKLSFKLSLPPYSHRLPASIYLYAAIRTQNGSLSKIEGGEIVRKVSNGLILRMKPGKVCLCQ